MDRDTTAMHLNRVAATGAAHDGLRALGHGTTARLTVLTGDCLGHPGRPAVGVRMGPEAVTVGGPMAPAATGAIGPGPGAG